MNLIGITATIIALTALVVGCKSNPSETSSIPQEDLRSFLHEECSKGHTPLTYRQLWTAIKRIDGDGDNIRLVYSQELRSIELNGGDKGDWNREHAWPKSYGLDKSGADYTDLHNIFPCDMQTNSRRGNKFYDNSTDRDSWCPPDEVKGDLARAMFYMAIRYDGSDRDTTDLKLSDNPDTDKSNFGKLSTLIEWHKLDPVDEKELRRNSQIEKIQGNRNLFVDQPEAVERVFRIN